MPADTTS